jgi:hypothetical protein
MTIFNGKSGENAFVAELRWPKNKRLLLILSFLLSGLPIGLAGGLIAYTITAAGVGAITTTLVAVGIVSFPIFGPISVGVITAAISTIGVFVFNSKKNQGMAGPQSTFDIKSPLHILGAYVAKIIFIPVVGMAICDKNVDDNELKFISSKMEAWGFSGEFVNHIIGKYRILGIDEIKKEIIQTKEVEGKSKYMKGTNLKELYKKSYSICDELKRMQSENTVEKASYLDWLKNTTC